MTILVFLIFLFTVIVAKNATRILTKQVIQSIYSSGLFSVRSVVSDCRKS